MLLLLVKAWLFLLVSNGDSVELNCIAWNGNDLLVLVSWECVRVGLLLVNGCLVIGVVFRIVIIRLLGKEQLLLLSYFCQLLTGSMCCKSGFLDHSWLRWYKFLVVHDWLENDSDILVLISFILSYYYCLLNNDLRLLLNSLVRILNERAFLMGHGMMIGIFLLKVISILVRENIRLLLMRSLHNLANTLLDLLRRLALRVLGGGRVV